MFTIDQAGKITFVLLLGAMAGACLKLAWWALAGIGAVLKGMNL
jgi:hypothetical protein